MHSPSPLPSLRVSINGLAMRPGGARRSRPNDGTTRHSVNARNYNYLICRCAAVAVVASIAHTHEKKAATIEPLMCVRTKRRNGATGTTISYYKDKYRSIRWLVICLRCAGVVLRCIQLNIPEIPGFSSVRR